MKKRISKKQGYNMATKKAKRNHDAEKLDNIETHLMNLISDPNVIEREKIIKNENFTTREKTHETDLVLSNGIHLHHDTVKVHCELGFPDQDEKTKKRDMDYERAGIPYIIINQDLANSCNLDEAELAVYLYYHELHKQEIKNGL